MNLFISGWAGFRQALDVPQEWHFIVPFIDFDEEGILKLLSNKSGSILIGWSTGGHIVLKNLDFFSERFEKIIIVAGFKRFTNYVNQRIIRKMIQKMEIEPESVIKEFLKNVGAKPYVPENIDKKTMIKGLEFLINSNFINQNIIFKNLTFIHGREDIILPLKALYDLKALFKGCSFFVVEGSHWINFKEIENIIKVSPGENPGL